MIIQQVQQHIARYCPPGSHLLVGFSGGADSLCLLHILHQLQGPLQYTITAAHLNHEWYPQEDNNIASWCAQWCSTRNIPYVSACASDINYDIIDRGSQEDRARQLRRHFLTTTAQQRGAHAILLGHHQEDQAETMLIRAIRGSSLEGLCGMQIQQGMYIRPLLYTSKQDILIYLAEHGLHYQQDPANTQSCYLRNRIRQQVLPALQEVDERAVQGISNTMQHLQEMQSWFHEHTIALLHSMLTSEHHLQLQPLRAQSSVVRRHLLLQWFIMQKLPCQVSSAWLHEIERFIMMKQGGTHQVHAQWQLRKQGPLLRIIKTL